MVKTPTQRNHIKFCDSWKNRTILRYRIFCDSCRHARHNPSSIYMFYTTKTVRQRIIRSQFVTLNLPYPYWSSGTWYASWQRSAHVGYATEYLTDGFSPRLPKRFAMWPIFMLSILTFWLTDVKLPMGKKLRAWSLELRAWNKKPETRNQKLETRN